MSLPTIRSWDELNAAWRHRIEPLLPDETDILGRPKNTYFEVIDDRHVRFRFDPVPNADSHDIEWSTDADFRSMKGTRVHSDAFEFEVPLHKVFACDLKYYFRYRGIKGNRVGAWSPTAIFSTPIPAALLNFFGEHAVDNTSDENTFINLKLYLPRTATLGSSTIEDPEAIWVNHVEVEANWSTLSGAINDSTTSITVATGEGPYFKDFGYYKIESEIVQVTNVTGDVLTVTRAVLGTTAAAHADTTAVRFFSRLKREMFTAEENGTYAVVLTIPNPEKVRTRDFTAIPFNTCGIAGPSSNTQVTLALPAAITDLAADPRFQKVRLTWSELAPSAYRYEVYVSNTATVPINDADPTQTAGVSKIAKPLADHEGEHEFIHEVVYSASVVWYYGVRAVDILGGVGTGDTVGPLQPDQFPTTPSPDVTNISASEGPAGLPQGVPRRARVVMQSSVTCGFDPPTAGADPDGLFDRCKIYVQAIGTQTTLDGAINGVVTTLTVPAGGVQKLTGWRFIEIDSEHMEITAFDYINNQVTVVRGVDGTTATSHADLAPIKPEIQPLFTGAEGPTAPLRFTHWPIGDATLYFVSVNKDGRENAVLSSPNLTVTMDGQSSAPLEVQNLRGMKTTTGGLIFWDEALEPDADVYQIADLGSRTLVNQADITDAQIVAQIPVNQGSSNKVRYEWTETLYKGKVTTGSNTITLFEGNVLREDQFDPIGSPPVKETLRFVTSTDTSVSSTDYDIDDTNKDGGNNSTIVLNSIPSEASANSTVEFYIGLRAHKFYVRVINNAGQASEWRPVEGTFLELAATAPDGTNDIGPPTGYADPTVTLAGTNWVPGWLMDAIGSTSQPGKVFVNVWARSEDETESNFDDALKRSINGIVEVEINVQHSDDGVTGLKTDSFYFPVATPAKSAYSHIVPGVGNPFWKVALGGFEIVLPSQGIPRTTGITVRLRNYFGWQATATTAKPFTTGSPAVEFTGAAALQADSTESVQVNTIYPNLSEASAKLVPALSADVTVSKPEYRGDTTTPGGGAEVGRGGEIFTITHEQPAAGTTYKVSFDSNYVGFDGKPTDMRHNRYTTWTCQVVTSTKIRCIGYVNGSLV